VEEPGQLGDRDPVGRVARRAPGFDHLVGGHGTGGTCFGNATILLYLAITFAVRWMVVIDCSRRMSTSGQNQVTALT